MLGLPGGSGGKESTLNAGDSGDAGSIPGPGGSPGGGNGNPLHVLAWRIPWTEEPGHKQSHLPEVTEHAHTRGHARAHTHTHTRTHTRTHTHTHTLTLKMENQNLPET